jgi:hypothetical protein
MVNDDLWALRITTDYKIIYEFQAHYVRDFECDGEIMVYIDDPYVGVKVVAYNWDIDSQSFTNHIIGYDFDLIEQNAKRLLYTEQDFSATITFLAQFLSDPALVSRMPPSCASSSCEFIVDWYIPHLRYLLGIAYEMNNQPEQAKQVYYNLWKDYPANIFGLAAAAKLKPIQP